MDEEGRRFEPPMTYIGPSFLSFVDRLKKGDFEILEEKLETLDFEKIEEGTTTMR